MCIEITQHQVLGSKISNLCLLRSRCYNFANFTVSTCDIPAGKTAVNATFWGKPAEGSPLGKSEVRSYQH